MKLPPAKPRRRLRTLALAIAVAALGTFVLVAWLGREPTFQGRRVSEWARDLQSPDNPTRSKAEAAMRSLGPDAVQVLADLVLREEPPYKARLRHLAGKLPAPVRRFVAGILKPFQPQVDRLSAAKGLALVGTNAAVAIPALVQAMHAPDHAGAYVAAHTLAGLGAPAFPALIKALGDSNAWVRSRAVIALGYAGPAAAQATPQLIARFTDTHLNVPRQASFTLSRIGTNAIPALTNALLDADYLIREHSLAALRQMGPVASDAIPAIARSAGDPQATVRLEAALAISAIAVFSSNTVLTLRPLLQDPQAAVRQAAAEGIQRAGRRSIHALPELVRALDDPDPAVRAAACGALGNAGPAAASSAPVLRARLTDDVATVRTAAEAALKRIGAPADP